MKEPILLRIIKYFTYGVALAIAAYNVKLSAQGFAQGEPIEIVDWLLSLGMFCYEFCLTTSLTTSALWPALMNSSNKLFTEVLKIGDVKYQFVSMAILVALITGLGWATYQCYKWDIATTELAVFEGQPPSPIDQFAVYGLVFGPEALVAGAGLLTVAIGFNQAQFSSLQYKGDKRRSGPDLTR